MRHVKRGFTLIELILVILVLTIMAGLAVPDFHRTYRHMQLKTTAQDIANTLRYGQTRAIGSNRYHSLIFDETLRHYWLAEEVEGSDPRTFARFTGRMGQKFAIPGDIVVTLKEPSWLLKPDGTLQRRRAAVCRQEQCYVVSAMEQRGFVHVYPQSSSEALASVLPEDKTTPSEDSFPEILTDEDAHP